MKQVIVGRFTVITHADLARLRLESEGIESYIKNETIAPIHPAHVYAHGIQLAVREEDAEAAEKIIQDFNFS
jgi:hypothetical protein